MAGERELWEESGKGKALPSSTVTWARGGMKHRGRDEEMRVGVREAEKAARRDKMTGKERRQSI